MKMRYIAAESWPNDATEITQDIYDQYTCAAPTSKIIGTESGHPCWIDVPPCSDEENIKIADNTKLALMAVANNAITPLQDAIDLDMANQAETVLLTAWRRYRVMLSRVDTSVAPNIDWPTVP